MFHSKKKKKKTDSQKLFSNLEFFQTILDHFILQKKEKIETNGKTHSRLVSSKEFDFGKIYGQKTDA
jgi:hypothetical protein